MRDISAGRDIVGCTFTEYVGDNISQEILQQGAEELAVAERNSRRVVAYQRKERSKRAAILGTCALFAFGVAALLGYFWLLRGGAIGIPELIHDASNIAMGALVSTLVAIVAGLLTASLAVGQKDPNNTEKINLERLKMVHIRWEELKGLGFPKAEIKKLRKK